MLSLLARDGTVQAEAVAARFGVSIWTVRRDLNELEARGALQRKHGGARATLGDVGTAWSEDSLRRSETLNLEAKQRIGRAAAQLVCTNTHLVLSAGTTTLEAARALRALRYHGEVVTNDRQHRDARPARSAEGWNWQSVLEPVQRQALANLLVQSAAIQQAKLLWQLADPDILGHIDAGNDLGLLVDRTDSGLMRHEWVGKATRAPIDG